MGDYHLQMGDYQRVHSPATNGFSLGFSVARLGFHCFHPISRATHPRSPTPSPVAMAVSTRVSVGGDFPQKPSGKPEKTSKNGLTTDRTWKSAKYQDPHGCKKNNSQLLFPPGAWGLVQRPVP